ncbi:MAG: gamma-glutamyl-gamma-aminobutyrate hydrolase family protein [Planctomycetes bacterium]|nr:gamma-glutamyl-gamma-aminobutyrate hydrolase family protein [Planctomycetota bacterium]NOG54640.1 type 1 glutamine amidotransferase [Planctomycetota bacterium]
MGTEQHNDRQRQPRAPRIGITCDITTDPATGRRRYRCADHYAQAVTTAGGTPMLLPPLVDHCESYLSICDGFVFTGGDDPKMEPFGAPTHSQAALIDPHRQAFETALLQQMPATKPVLGVCLGMQMMALVAGGTLNQHLPDDWPTHADHADGKAHTVTFDTSTVEVNSHHHQAVTAPGRNLAVVARAHDGLIEAIQDHNRPFYLGVQWHPERMGDGPAGLGLFAKLVETTTRLRADS